MITVRRSSERGTTRTDWLDSKHTFSFAEYYDPTFENFGALRVINSMMMLCSCRPGSWPRAWLRAG